MYLFLRRLRLGRAAAWLGGLVFAGSAFMVVWTGWPQTRVAALIPALFWAVERLVQRVRPREVALVALAVAGMLLGGFPAVTGYALLTAAAYLVVRVLASDRLAVAAGLGRRAGAAAGVAAGVALAAWQLLPWLHYMSTVLVAAGPRSPSKHHPGVGAADHDRPVRPGHGRTRRTRRPGSAAWQLVDADVLRGRGGAGAGRRRGGAGRAGPAAAAARRLVAAGRRQRGCGRAIYSAARCSGCCSARRSCSPTTSSAGPAACSASCWRCWPRSASRWCCAAGPSWPAPATAAPADAPGRSGPPAPTRSAVWVAAVAGFGPSSGGGTGTRWPRGPPR